MRCLLGLLLYAMTTAILHAAEYTGPIIDAHAHVPNATAIATYVAAMQRHHIVHVLLLGVGGVQPDDPAWLTAAARQYPAQVLLGAPVADPAAATAVAQLETLLATRQWRAIGEVHVRQSSRQIERNPADPTFLRLLAVAAKYQTPVIIHQELDERARLLLAQALSAVPQATIILAHGGGTTPAHLATLLAQHANLRVDLSGMHFQRTPALATEHGPMDPAWKAVIEQMPERFVIGIDIWAARLFTPAMLDRLMRWTRRMLGELRPDVAAQVAYKNAAALLRVE